MVHRLAAAALTAFLAAAAGSAIAQPDANIAAKLSALQKACAAGVFTPQECTQRRAALHHQAPAANVASAAAPDQAPANMFHDPDNRFSAPVPAGWNTSDNNGTVQFSSGGAWVVLVTSPAPTPEQAANDFLNQINGQYQKLDQINAGKPTINGHHAAFGVFKGVNGKGSQVDIMVAGIQAPGNHVLIFMSSAPFDQINSYSPQFLKILNGIRFAGEN